MEKYTFSHPILSLEHMKTVLSNMAAVEYNSNNDSTVDLSKTVVLSDETVKEMEAHEISGIPLQSSWTFWLGNSTRGTTVEQYKENLMKIYTVNTVQSFWSVFNNIPNPSAITLRYGYHFMRDERYPLWEEPSNRNGGTWRLKCSKSDTDKIWKEMLVALIGEQFTKCVAEGDDVCGISIILKDREDVFQIWNTNAALASKATVLNKVDSLLPKLNLFKFYKPHQTHFAFGRS